VAPQFLNQHHLPSNLAQSQYPRPLQSNSGSIADTTRPFTVFGKHCECIAQKCTHLERLPPLASQLLLLSHCVLIQHGGPKKKSVTVVRSRESNQVRGRIQSMDQPSTLFNQSYPMDRIVIIDNDDLFKVQITFAENGKIQLTPKITNDLFTYYLNCMCKSNPVCLIHQWSVTFLLASYVQ